MPVQEKKNIHLSTIKKEKRPCATVVDPVLIAGPKPANRYLVAFSCTFTTAHHFLVHIHLFPDRNVQGG